MHKIIIQNNMLFEHFQREAAKTVIEKYQEYAQEQKTKIEELGVAQQQKRGKRKRKH